MTWTEPESALAFANAALLFVAVLLYALLGGIDFGGGVWDLFARGRRGAAQREAATRAIGPIWEASHVWLLFLGVLILVVFPRAFPALAVALAIPFCLALLGIVLRGAISVAHGRSRGAGCGTWDRLFAVASALTPVFFGMTAGAAASGQIRIVDGVVVSDRWTTWLAPFPLAVGAIALAICAYLAAVYLTLATTGEVQEDFRVRALATGLAFAALAAIALPIAEDGAPLVWHGLMAEAMVIVPLGIGLALLSGWAVYVRSYRLGSVAAAAEVALLLAGWARAQYPYLIVPDLTVHAAAGAVTPRTEFVVFALGVLLLIPSLWVLVRVSKADLPTTAETRPETYVPRGD
jgi:cytochrome bd ubiquinol oxidase subunit II